MRSVSQRDIGAMFSLRALTQALKTLIPLQHDTAA